MFPAFILFICLATAVYLAFEKWPDMKNYKLLVGGVPVQHVLAGFAVSVLVFVVVLLLLTGRLHLFGALIGGLLLWGNRGLGLISLWQRFIGLGRNFGVPGAPAATGMGHKTGQISKIATLYFEMQLEHDTGEIAGRVLKGHLAGATLESLTEQQARKLYAECYGDENSRRVYETWLNRYHPEWQNWGKAFFDDLEQGGASHPASAAGMKVEEACEILGVSKNADEKTIKEAHHKLMARLHPDQGGSNYFAAKLNEARETLLKNKAL